MRPIRNSAKALIIQNGKLLCTKNRDPFGIYYLLPGGGQNPGESLQEALQRECREEIGTEVVVKRLRYIREYIGKNHEFAKWDADFHQIEFMFECELAPGTILQEGELPDNAQIGVEWLNLQELERYRIYPKALTGFIGDDGKLAGGIYLGDIN